MVDGVRILKVEHRDRPLVESLNIWDRDGTHVAKLRRGAWSFVADGYESSSDPKRLRIWQGDRTLVEFRLVENGVAMAAADFYTPGGIHVAILSDDDPDLTGKLVFFNRDFAPLLEVAKTKFDGVGRFDLDTEPAGDEPWAIVGDVLQIAPGIDGGVKLIHCEFTREEGA